MFTIKHVLPNGDENLYEGTNPCFISDPQSEGRKTKGVFHFTDDKSRVHPINTGRVYVMNVSGSTIASYDLRHQAKSALPRHDIP
jgi:hypothetical protein